MTLDEILKKLKTGYRGLPDRAVNADWRSRGLSLTFLVWSEISEKVLFRE